VGYSLSPLLWRKVKKGLSAGRVQSVAVKLVVDREREIQAFVPKEYWGVRALLANGEKKEFEAKLFKIEGKNFEINNEKEATKVKDDLEKAEYVVSKVESKDVKRNPYPPFITSTLQQDAARKLRYTAKRTMMVAQQLYEGIELGPDGHTGLNPFSFRLVTRSKDDAVAFFRVAGNEEGFALQLRFQDLGNTGKEGVHIG
jgi:DNA topoisomerase-1